ncbi:MAG: hypothetical protein E7L11_12395 [Klebsiella oxytoca]|nr:hypothetical protein [Klebsiella oxytoca]
MLKLLKNTKRHFMTGVSYMIPFVVAGGVLLALAVMFNGEAAVPDHGFLKAMSQTRIRWSINRASRRVPSAA